MPQRVYGLPSTGINEGSSYGSTCNSTLAYSLSLPVKSRAVTLYSFLASYTGQKEFYAVVQGFDLDGDGKIDSVEVLE